MGQRCSACSVRRLEEPAGQPPLTLLREKPSLLKSQELYRGNSPGCRAQRSLRDKGRGELYLEEAALKLVFNEWVRSEPMERSRTGVGRRGVGWSSSLGPGEAISLVLSEMI